MSRARANPSAPGFDMREFTDPDRIDIDVGEPFVVVLSDNGPGGYLWHLERLPPGLRLRREDDLSPGEGAPGATGEKVFELVANEPGTFILRFERRRDWEPGADRELTPVVNVRAPEQDISFVSGSEPQNAQASSEPGANQDG